MLYNTIIFAIFVFVLTGSASAQRQAANNFPPPYLESGNVYTRNFSPKEYKAAPQNWSVLVDRHGVLNIGNGDGVLTYDGKVWTLIETPTQSVIRSLAMDDEGTVYVGALDDFGFLQQTATGRSEYVSLLSHVKPEFQRMGNAWSIFTHAGVVYFGTDIGVFRWNGERMQFTAWPNLDAWHKAYLWGDTYFLCEQGTGLLFLDKDKFSLADGGLAFKDRRIYGFVPLGSDKALFGTQFDGLYVYDKNQAKPFRTQADSFMSENQVYTMRQLPDNTFAVGTKRGGIVMVDQSGVVRGMMNTGNTLSSDIIYDMTVDPAGTLWVSTDNGISQLEINNHLTTFFEGVNLNGVPNDILRYQGTLYVATNLGLYALRKASYPQAGPKFERIAAIKSTCWRLLVVDDVMLVASNEGLFEVRGRSVRMILPLPSYDVHRYVNDPTRILIGGDFDWPSLKRVNDTWQPVAGVNNVRLDNIHFTEVRPGKLWITTFSQGATLIDFEQPDGTIDYDHAIARSFGTQQGLPEGYIKTNNIDNDVLFRVGSASKMFRFNPSQGKFFPDTVLEKRYGLDSLHVFPTTDERTDGSFLCRSQFSEKTKKKLIRITPRSDTDYVTAHYDLSRIFESTSVITYEEDNGFIWHGGGDGIVRQELVEADSTSPQFSTFINKIVLLGDSVFFQGIGDIRGGINFSHASNSLRFEFTSTNYVAPEANRFQYQLAGYDETWSDWTEENIKEYPRLHEGEYRFQVRSRNFAGFVSAPTTFSFTVAPPWYRTVYAYAGYFMAASLFIWGLVRWRSYQLVQERQALRREIAARTQEITKQNIKLAEQSEELKANAEQLKELDKLKSTFFVNISHEFRTPLSLILGPLEKLMEGPQPDTLRRPDAERMHRNAKRLQQLINQLLDLAKLESGNMTVHETKVDLIYFMRVLSASFESLAEIRSISYIVNIPSGAYFALFDDEKIETVLYNLLSNAFKFTPDGGRIEFELALPQDPSNPFIRVCISDSGPGIPASQRDKIFDRFYQVDSSSSREFEGSGIGLSLVKELVALLRGNISVESEIGKGTRFVLEIPMKVATDGIGAHEVIPMLLQETSVNGSRLQSELDSVNLASTKTSSAGSVILLVEDNEDLRNYLKENLEADYRIEMAANGKIGLEAALELVPDLIVSDMMMPVMDGFALCAAIREDPRTSHIPFILLTARTTIESKLEGLELGADEYMTKPFHIKEIRIRIKNLLEQRKKLQQSYSKTVTLQPKNISVTSIDEKFLTQALAIVEEHMADQQFSVERFAELIGMSRKNLLRKIKALTDQSVNEFIRNFRLRRAAQLLAGRSATVSEIAYQVGFNNLSYFSKCFKDLFGVLPNEYQPGRNVLS